MKLILLPVPITLQSPGRQNVKPVSFSHIRLTWNGGVHEHYALVYHYPFTDSQELDDVLHNNSAPKLNYTNTMGYISTSNSIWVCHISYLGYFIFLIFETNNFSEQFLTMLCYNVAPTVQHVSIKYKINGAISKPAQYKFGPIAIGKVRPKGRVRFAKGATFLNVKCEFS